VPDPITSTIPGAEELIASFGEWPKFHDAEVVELSLKREGRSWLRVHAWRTTTEFDVVSFWFDGVLDLELAGFSGQNVIFGLTCEKSENGFRVTMFPCFGIAGYIEAKRVSVSFEPSIRG